jgi:hypothetical protein
MICFTESVVIDQLSFSIAKKGAHYSHELSGGIPRTTLVQSVIIVQFFGAYSIEGPSSAG